MAAMVRKQFVYVLVFFLLGSGASVAHAQLLQYDSNTLVTPTFSNQTTVTVGTTTVQVGFETPVLQRARQQLSDILYFLRLFESPNTTSRATIDAPTSGIVQLAFESETSRGVSSDEGVFAEPVSSACTVFTVDLSIGDAHPQVRELQAFLNKNPQTRVSATGSGSVGSETDFFGARTQNAVILFQELYKESILTPLNLETPTGFWGAATRSHANTLHECGQ